MTDLLGYEGKVCVVTGAASGIGKAICEKLLSLDAKVYGLDLKEPDYEGVHYVKVNLGEKNSIDEAFRRLPDKIDAFFAAAGIPADKRFPFEMVFHVNFTSNKYMMDAYLLDRMKKGGAIAIISSMAGANWDKYMEEYKDIADAAGWEETAAKLQEKDLAHTSENAPYQLSKRAVIYYAMKMVKDFGQRGVRINVLMPGSTLTPMTQKVLDEGLGEELLKTDGVAGRLADVREMAEPMIFLNSNMASFITANILQGDCGYFMMDYVGVQDNDHFYDYKIFNGESDGKI